MMNKNQELKNKLTLTKLYLFGISTIIGAGVFLTPGRAYAFLGTNFIWVLIVCIILSLMIGLVFSEMGGVYTRTGGLYVYVYELLGPTAGFHIGFIRILASCVALGVQMVALPNMLTIFFPNLIQHTYLCLTISIITCFLITCINLRTIKITSFFVNIISWLIMIILVFCIIVSFFHFNLSHITTITYPTIPKLGHLTASQFSSGFLLIFYMFVGFENIGVAASDIHNPSKNVPKAIILTLFTIALIYILLFTSIIGSLGQDIIYTNNSVAEAIKLELGDKSSYIVCVGGIVAIIGLGLTMSFSGARNIVPMSIDGFFPKRLSENNTRNVPVRSILLIFAISVVIIIFAYAISKSVFSLLVSVASVCRLMEYFFVTLGMYRLRKKQYNSYKAPYYQLIVPIILILCAGLIIDSNMEILLLTAILVIFTFLVYIFYSRRCYKKIHQSTAEKSY